MRTKKHHLSYEVASHGDARSHRSTIASKDHYYLRDLSSLLPIRWSPITQTGADVMKRIATPMIGGVVTSTLLELLIYPIIFLMWRGRKVGAS